MYSLQIGQVVVTDVHTYTEVQPSISSIHDLEMSELKINCNIGSENDDISILSIILVTEQTCGQLH